MESQNLRDLIIEVIKTMPETSTLEEITCRIDIMVNVLEGLRDGTEGNTIGTTDLLRKINKWH